MISVLAFWCLYLIGGLLAVAYVLDGERWQIAAALGCLAVAFGVSLAVTDARRDGDG